MIRKLRILLIDDDEMVHEIVRSALTEDEFDLRMTMDVNSGLREVVRFSPDLVLLDYIMPGLSGFDAIEELKSHQLTKKIPVLILSSSENAEVIENFYKHGAIDYLNKPIIPRILREKIRALAQNFDLADCSNPCISGNITAFYGVKGGVGTTTVACNSAIMLAQRVVGDKEKVLLLEANGNHSCMRYFFDVKAKTTLQCLIKEHPFDLDEKYLFLNLLKAGDNLYMVPSGVAFGQFHFGSEVLEDIAVVLQILSNSFDYIIVDMDHSYSEINQYLHIISDTLMLVTNTSSQSLQNLHDTVGALRRDNISEGKLTVVLNAIERNDKISTEGVMKFVGIPVAGKFKRDDEKYRAAEEARNLIVMSPRSATVREFEELVERIIERSQSKIHAQVEVRS